MKIIAYFLPQFHVIPENDRWWGTGFTEWTNTKKAKPLFIGQYQPRESMNDFYYDLTDSRVRKWQADVAKKYGVYGFCYYHYWFSGDKLLEKPLEDLLFMKDVDLPFCICWANHTWNRSWTHEENEVLKLQTYGDKDEWEAHFDYLIRFFKDDRYIKIDNKPILVIYRPSDIPNCEQRLAYYNDRAIENGFSGIYLIDTLHMRDSECGSNIEGFDAVVEFEPLYSFEGSFAQIQYYDDIWKRILERKRTGGKKVFLGAFPGWDNTARKHEKGLYVVGSTPEKFGKYIRHQIEIAEKLGSELIFVNAWNEWAEGAYLEPDKKYGYGYLENLKSAIDGKLKESNAGNNYDKKIIDLIPKSAEMVLTVNCKSASLAKVIREKYGATVIGIEKRKEYEHFAENNLQFLIPVDADHDSLEVLGTNSIDCIIMEESLGSHKNPLGLLSKLKSLLTKEGCIIVSVNNVGHIEVIHDLIREGSWKHSIVGKAKEEIRYFTKTDFIKSVEKLGYEIVSTKEEKKAPTEEHQKTLNFIKKNLNKLQISNKRILDEYEVYRYIFKIRSSYRTEYQISK